MNVIRFLTGLFLTLGLSAVTALAMRFLGGDAADVKYAAMALCFGIGMIGGHITLEWATK